MAIGGGSSGGGDAAAEEARRQSRIRAGKGKVDRVFSQFTPDFYNQQSRSYTEYATPQVEDQFTAAAEKLKFALARQFGTTQTSEAAKRQAELAKRYALARAQVTDQAIAKSTEARGRVEDQRSKIFQILNQTADPSAAANMALGQAEILSKPDPFVPLADLFGDVSAGLAAQYGPGGGINNTNTGQPAYSYDPASNQYKRAGSSRVVQ